MRMRRRMGSGSWRRVVTWAAVSVVAALVAAELLAGHFVDASFVSRQLGRRLGPTFRVEIRKAHFSLLRGSLDVEGLRVGRVDADSAAAKVGPDLAVARLRMRGLDRLSLLQGRVLSMSRLAIDTATLRIRAHALTRASRRGGEGVPPNERLGGALPPLRIGRVQVTRADLILVTDGGATMDSVPGLRASLVDLRTDAERPTGRGRVLFSRDVRLELPTYRHVTADGMYVLALDSVALSTRDSTLSVARLGWHPALAPSDFVRRIRHRRDYVELVAGGIRSRHVDFPELVARHGFVAGWLGADSVRVSVWNDRTVPADTGATSPGMPTDWVSEPGVPLALDTGVVRSATVTYSETPPGGGPRGSVRFEGVSARLVGLANTRARLLRRARSEAAGGSPGRTELHLRGELEGRARLTADLAVDLGADSLDLLVSGGLGPMQATVVDSATTSLAGVRLATGTVDTVGFELRLEGRRATGRVHALYHDLSIQKASPGEGSPDLLERIGTVVLQRRLWSSNPGPADREPRVGTVDYTRKESDTFFAYVWDALRSGLVDVLEK